MEKSVIRYLFNSVFISRFPEVILWWQGGDVERLYSFPPGIPKIKVFAFRFLMKRLTKHPNLTSWVNTKNMIPMLKDFGFKKIIHQAVPVKEEFIKYAANFYQIEHEQFNVLCYLKNQWYHKHERFIYGYEYFEELKKHYKNDDTINFISVDGTMDMTKICPYVDCYVKINRMPHNDRNLISKECELLGIPEKAFTVFDKSFNEALEEIIEWINIKKDIWLTRNGKKSSY